MTTDISDLFAQEQTAMLRLAVLVVGDRELAEDIVQDAFFAVSLRSDHIANAGGYLRTCVVNGCRMALRRRATATRSTPWLPLAVEADSSLCELRDALSTLPERQRLVLILRYLEDVPDAAIAEAMGCREATVRSLASRGLRHLRKDFR